MCGFFEELRSDFADSEWVSEWVEFNAPLDTIQVISEAEFCD